MLLKKTVFASSSCESLPLASRSSRHHARQLVAALQDLAFHIPRAPAQFLAEFAGPYQLSDVLNPVQDVEHLSRCG